MQPKDDIILETLSIGAALSISGIELNSRVQLSSPVSESTCRRRLDDLIAGGLVATVGEAGRFYRLTEEGQRYLDGEYQPPEMDDAEE